MVRVMQPKQQALCAMSEQMKTVCAARYVLFAGIVIVGFAVDLMTKRWVFDYLGMPYQRPSLWLIDKIFGFTTSLNEGGLFGIGQGKAALFGGLSIVAAFGILYWLFVAGAANDRQLTIALALVTAGIFGNLYDRLGFPGLTWAGEPVLAVRDWIHFKIEGIVDWPIFNVADVLLDCGVALLVWHTLRTTPNVAAHSEVQA
jgi:signal peptidase II